MKHLIVLLGKSGIGKTTTISGPRSYLDEGGKRRLRPLGKSHAGFPDCLMSRVPWREAAPLEPIGKQDHSWEKGAPEPHASGTRIVELGRRPVAYLWTWDGGHRNETGRIDELRRAFGRYDVVLTDAMVMAAYPYGRRILAEAQRWGVRVTCPILEMDEGAYMLRLRGRKPGVEPKPDWLKKNRHLYENLPKLNAMGIATPEIREPFVDGLVEILAGLER